jgi:hypothetical protein
MVDMHHGFGLALLLQNGGPDAHSRRDVVGDAEYVADTCPLGCAAPLVFIGITGFDADACHR